MHLKRGFLFVSFLFLSFLGCGTPPLLDPGDPNAVEIQEGFVVYNKLRFGIRLRLISLEDVIADKSSIVGTNVRVKGELSPGTSVGLFSFNSFAVSVRREPDGRLVEFDLSEVFFNEAKLNIIIDRVEKK